MVLCAACDTNLQALKTLKNCHKGEWLGRPGSWGWHNPGLLVGIPSCGLLDQSP